MHILFIGYGKTSQRVAKYLFAQGHQITTISRSAKTGLATNHLIQDIHHLDLSCVEPVDLVYILLSPAAGTAEAYRQVYIEPINTIMQALAPHPVKRIVIVSSTRVYGEQRGECINDDSMIVPADEQGLVLREMEMRWQAAYPQRATIIRPSGIYAGSVTRLVRLAHITRSYPGIHYSNRIHRDDLVRFLVSLSKQQQIFDSYIVTNNQPWPMHEILLWFQQQLGWAELELASRNITGKQIYATRLLAEGFKLEHPICFNDYQLSLKEHSQSSELN